jgi:hypothetical protein
MSFGQGAKDLAVLVADKNIEFAIKGLLGQRSRLGIRPITREIYRHPQQDSGCYRRCEELLRPFIKSFRYAIVIFDREGCGGGNQSREEIEVVVESRLTKNGWQNRAAVIAIEPELESWVWSNSPIVDEVCGWTDTNMSLRVWLQDSGWLQKGSTKPARPKEALEATLRRANEPRSSSLYEQIARKIDFRQCKDEAFLKFKSKLGVWFPLQPND